MNAGLFSGRAAGAGAGRWVTGTKSDAPSEDPTPVPHCGRRKKLRFHPRQLYLSVKQGELQKVILMLREYSVCAFVLRTSLEQRLRTRR